MKNPDRVEGTYGQTIELVATVESRAKAIYMITRLWVRPPCWVSGQPATGQKAWKCANNNAFVLLMMPLATHSLWLRDDGNLSGSLIIVEVLEIAESRRSEHPRKNRSQVPIGMKTRTSHVKKL